MGENEIAIYKQDINKKSEAELFEFENNTKMKEYLKKSIDALIDEGYKVWDDFNENYHIYLDDPSYKIKKITCHPNFLKSFLNDFYYDQTLADSPFNENFSGETPNIFSDAVLSNSHLDCVLFPKFVLTHLEMKYLPVTTLDKRSVKDEIDENEINILQTDFVNITTALSMIKTFGWIDEKLKEQSLLSITRLGIYNEIVGIKSSNQLSVLYNDLNNFSIY